MLRHTAFFLLREGIDADKRLRMLKGLAYMSFACDSVRSLDFGTDLFGGSDRLADTKPWKRTPRWRGRLEGPPSNYDVALHLDFDDQAGLDDYNHDDVHHEVGDYNASICRGELTARVDWWYDGEPLTAAGLVRHSAMFVWDDEVDDAAKDAAQAAVRTLGDEPGVRSLTIGKNVGTLTTDYDWLVDVQLEDRDAAAKLIEGPAYAEVMKSLSGVTKYEWTARLSHTMMGR